MDLVRIWNRLKPAAALDAWRLVKILLGSLLWLGLMVISFYSFITVPILVMVSVWIVFMIGQYLRPPPAPSHVVRPDEDDPLAG